MICEYTDQEIFELVNHQISNFWLSGGVPEEAYSSLKKALIRTEYNFSHRKGSIFQSDGQAAFHVTHSAQYAVFLCTYANQLYLDEYQDAADNVYYLNKIMNSVDWFYAVQFPSIWSAEHPLGSVVGRATIGEYLFLYQGTTIGGNRKNGKLSYPTLGDSILMYANSKILGDSHIGSNVIVSANAYLLNESIPDNCIVFG
ncbi:hypothetical protein ABXS75_00680 [Roseburia hominis]